MLSTCAHMQVAASARPEPALDIHDTYDGSDEEIERQLPATESAPRGARRFSEKYSENPAQVPLPAYTGFENKALLSLQQPRMIERSSCLIFAVCHLRRHAVCSTRADVDLRCAERCWSRDRRSAEQPAEISQIHAPLRKPNVIIQKHQPCKVSVDCPCGLGRPWWV